MNINENPTKRTKNRSFFKTAFLSLLALAIMITLLLTTFLTANYLKTSMQLTRKFNRNLLSQTNYTISQMQDNALRLTRTLFNNKDIISFLYMDELDPMIPILSSRVLDNQLMTLPYVESICLYNAQLDLFFSSKTGEQLSSSQFPDTGISQLITGSDDSAGYDGMPVTNHVGSDGVSQTISYVIFDNKNAIVINVYTSILTDAIRNMNQLQSGLVMDFLVMDAQGNVLSSVLNSGLPQPEGSIPVPAGPGESFTMLDGTSYLQASTNQNAYGWYIVSLVPSMVIFEDILTSSLIGALITILVFLFCLAFCLLLAKRLNSPIQAITGLIKGEHTADVPSQISETQEFQFILTVFQSMKEQNINLDKIKRETAYSMKQDCLNSLVTGNLLHSSESTKNQLHSLDLDYLLENPLCMVVLKVDNYKKFLSENNQKELWILRFAIVNISEELSAALFHCCVFSQDNDKFLLLIDCRNEPDYSSFREKLEGLLSEIQDNITKYMGLSMTAAYSTFFKGVEHLPGVYGSMEDSLLLKLKYGHGSIISPYMMDEMDTDVFQLPLQKLQQIITCLNDGKAEDCANACRQIASKLLTGSCQEIIPCTLHLLYGMYAGIVQKYPSLKENTTLSLQEALDRLQTAEIAPDIDELMQHFICSCCGEITELKSHPAQQNTDIITQKVRRLIDEEYPDPALCLSSAAAQLGLSPNYIGQIFKTAMGKSVAQYLQELRMEKLAYYLDHTNLPLTRILENVGLEMNNYFYTRFKKHFGMSLNEYRERNRK